MNEQNKVVGDVVEGQLEEASIDELDGVVGGATLFSLVNRSALFARASTTRIASSLLSPGQLVAAPRLLNALPSDLIELVESLDDAAE